MYDSQRVPKAFAEWRRGEGETRCGLRFMRRSLLGRRWLWRRGQVSRASWHADGNIATLVAAINVPVRLDQPLQRIAAIDDGPQLTFLAEGYKELEVFPARNGGSADDVALEVYTGSAPLVGAVRMA